MNIGKFILFFTLAILIIEAASAQEYWMRSFGTAENEIIFSVQQTSDGGYVLAGATGSLGDYDMWILKLDTLGNVQWQKTYGGIDDDFGYSLQQTSDGGYIIAGYTEIFGFDSWILKLDSQGNIQWQKTYGGSDFDSAESIQQTADGGYIVAGNSWSFGSGASDFWVFKLDSAGDIEWQNTYGGIGYDSPNSIQQTLDGGYIVGGISLSFNPDPDFSDFWVLKLDSGGNIQWQKIYAGDYDTPGSIKKTSDGGYIICWSIGFDPRVIKVDSTGNIQWEKTYGDFLSAGVIEETSDGGYIMAANIDDFNFRTDFWVVKLDSSGDILWQKAYGGSEYEFVRSIQQTSEGGYIVAGDTYTFGAGPTDAWILKLDNNGGINSSCPFIRDTSVVPLDFLGTVSDTIESPSSTFVSPVSSSVSPMDSGAIMIEQCPNASCILCDEFNDGVLDPNWTYLKNSSYWSEDGNNLIGFALEKRAIAVADPVFAGCTNCKVETVMSTSGGGLSSRIWLLFHVQNAKSDVVELIAKDGSDRWVLKHRIGKKVVAKAKLISLIDPNAFYTVSIRYDGTNFIATIGGAGVITLAPGGPVSGGTVGFKARKTVGTFQRISVTPESSFMNSLGSAKNLHCP